MMANSDGGSRADSWYVAFRNPELPGGRLRPDDQNVSNRVRGEAVRIGPAGGRLRRERWHAQPTSTKKTIGLSQVLSWLEFHKSDFVHDHPMIKKTS